MRLHRRDAPGKQRGGALGAGAGRAFLALDGRRISTLTGPDVRTMGITRRAAFAPSDVPGRGQARDPARLPLRRPARSVTGGKPGPSPPPPGSAGPPR